MSAFYRNEFINILLDAIIECANGFDIAICITRIDYAKYAGLITSEDAVVMKKLISEKMESMGIINTRSFRNDD
jgi:hypothetical protein